MLKRKKIQKKINNVLFITTQSGKQLTFKVLFTYYSEIFQKDYAVFYNEEDENHLIAYAFDENGTLSALEKDEEYAELNKALQQFDEEGITND